MDHKFQITRQQNNLMFNFHPTSNNDNMKKVLPINSSMDDLRKDHEIAVDCLIQCQSVIKTMEEELASKDQRIASLEERLVQMSLELASSKALEDEHRLIKRRTIRKSSHGSDCEFPYAQAIKSKLASTIECLASENDYTPVKKTHKNARPSAKPRPVCSQSWTVRSQPWVSAPSIPNDAGSVPQAPYTSRHAFAIDLGSVRRLSDLGQYLGLTRNDTLSDTEVEADRKVTLSSSASERGIVQKARRHSGRKRSNLQSSTGSLISAVVFPVNSSEVLTGCLSPGASVGLSTNRTNELWPDF